MLKFPDVLGVIIKKKDPIYRASKSVFSSWFVVGFSSLIFIPRIYINNIHEE